MTTTQDKLPPLKVLSLGAGVQSTTLALMASRGEIEKPDFAIFADTGWEPQSVYEHLERLRGALQFPLVIVSNGNIRQDIEDTAIDTSRRFPSIPWWSVGRDGRPAPGLRQCTEHYKLIPIWRHLRGIVSPGGGRPASGSVELWIGISRDEAVRMKPSPKKWICNRWPLIEKGMTRADCEQWLAMMSWSAPKSACIGCPYRSTESWREIRSSQSEWDEAVRLDKIVRNSRSNRGLLSSQYMHRSCVPLDLADLRTDKEKGQMHLPFEECSGICGT